MTITSSQNEHLKQLRKLRERKHRERTGLFAAEGEDLLEAALRHGNAPIEVFYDAERMQERDPLLAALPESTRRLPVTRSALESASALGSGSRVIGVWQRRFADLDAATGTEAAVYLHETADPGNVGTVLRSALALARTVVILSSGSADPFGPKAVRASMGAIFGQPVATASFGETCDALQGTFSSVALVAGAGRPLRALEPTWPPLYCLGAERRGLPEEIVGACDEVAHIPLRGGGPESLNLAMTATLCLYETRLHILSRS